MARTATKVTISLPTDLVKAVDRRQQERGETRSEFIRYALERLFREERERQDVERYVRGYLEQPESEEEARAMEQLAVETLAAEPWQ